MPQHSSLGVALSAILLLTLTPSVEAAPSVPARKLGSGWAAAEIRKGSLPARDRELAGRLPGRAMLGYHPETGRVRSISRGAGRPLARPLAAVASGTRQLTPAVARSQARRFLSTYGQLFGLRDAGAELRVSATRRATAAGGARGLAPAAARRAAPTVVRFEQRRGGIPVMGGEIVVQVGGDGAVLSATGEVLPAGTVTPANARITVAAARAQAAAWLAREARAAAGQVITTSEGLAVYDPRIMDDPSMAGMGSRLVWRIDARLPARAGRAEAHRLVLVDARGGGVLTSIGRLLHAQRRVCDNRSVPNRPFGCNAPFTRGEGQPATGIRDVDAAYRLMGVTWDFYRDHLGRNGVNGNGSAMKSTVRYCGFGCPWRNAEWKWQQQQAIFGTGWARADDIVGHEFTHGVLDHEAPLFYQYQSGAINESYADVFGEIIDLTHPGGRDGAAVRWKIGEDTPIGVFRDMRNPTRHGHPDRVRSPRWHTSTADDGGVHRNSGVGNKAASLMADGGTFNGRKIKAIGRIRTARVWYQALTTRLTSAANYVDLGDALVAACSDLVGSGGLTRAHCESVRKATRATQMHLPPKKQAPASAPVCPAGRVPLDVFNDDLEDPGAGGWATGRLVGNAKGWYWPQNPNNNPAWDGSWSSSGKTNFYAPNRGVRSDTFIRMTESVLLPQGAYLRFEHGYSFDKDARRRYDGGIIQIKLDDGPWRRVDGLFTHGGYNGRLPTGYGNPLAGRRAWTGNSRGWSETRVDLSAFEGRRIMVRFRMGSDRSVGARGWYVDDVRIYSCAQVEPPD